MFHQEEEKTIYFLSSYATKSGHLRVNSREQIVLWLHLGKEIQELHNGAKPFTNNNRVFLQTIVPPRPVILMFHSEILAS